MPKSEIIIHQQYCKGCGYCEFFCPQNCIIITGEKLSPEGFLLPTFWHQESCKGCGICAQMCPEFAIEVYRINVEKK